MKRLFHGPTGGRLRDFLHGTWLGHPLHPVLTDVPIGAWSVALVLDIIDLAGRSAGLRPGADAAVAVGIAGAVGAAVTGITDWHHTEDSPRRVGLAHAVVNVSATALYRISLAMRPSENRVAGQALSMVGYGLLMLGGYMGGHLAFAQRVGMNQAAPAPRGAPPARFHRDCSRARAPRRDPAACGD